MTSSTDKIEKRVRLRASPARVWRAISDPAEFASWFGFELDGPFVAGATRTGRIRPTTLDVEIGKMQERFAGTPVTMHVERIEPMRLLSFRWHPFALDPKVDYSREPTTLVTFTLEPADDGTLLTVVESGFDALPLERRMAAFEANEEGWYLLLGLGEKHLRTPQA